jgi:hypothetical protein
LLYLIPGRVAKLHIGIPKSKLGHILDV